MKFRKPIVNILSDLVASILFPVKILKVTAAGNVYTINVDNAWHAQAGFKITIGAYQYTITSVSHLDSCNGGCDVIVVTDAGTNPITATSFTMYGIHFFYGTLVDGGIQLAQVADANQKLPMIFLRVDDTLSEAYHDDPEDSHERMSSVKLYFLSQGDETVLNTTAIPVFVDPMKRLAEIFIDAMNEAIAIFEIWQEDYNLTIYAKFGVYSGGKQPTKIWADDLSGCGMDIKFKILRNQDE
jgi:hypothetical protein